MQARAIFEAACDVTAKGGRVIPEIMIPLVGTLEELKDQATIVRRVAEETMKKKGVTVAYLVGTMIEVPRAAVTADRIAEEAEFFSFGTNDLTQMAFGFSRDDAGKFLPEYVSRKVLETDPFVSVDEAGVGELMRWAVERGRATRPKLKVGICGEHGAILRASSSATASISTTSRAPFRAPDRAALRRRRRQCGGRRPDRAGRAGTARQVLWHARLRILLRLALRRASPSWLRASAGGLGRGLSTLREPRASAQRAGSSGWRRRSIMPSRACR